MNNNSRVVIIAYNYGGGLKNNSCLLNSFMVGGSYGARYSSRPHGAWQCDQTLTTRIPRTCLRTLLLCSAENYDDASYHFGNCQITHIKNMGNASSLVTQTRLCILIYLIYVLTIEVYVMYDQFNT